jgi:hypothetical protein
MQVLSNIKHCILATDLALFFPNKARLANIVKENTFDWEHPDHRSSLFNTGKDEFGNIYEVAYNYVILLVDTAKL